MCGKCGEQFHIPSLSNSVGDSLCPSCRKHGLKLTNRLLDVKGLKRVRLSVPGVIGNINVLVLEQYITQIVLGAPVAFLIDKDNVVISKLKDINSIGVLRPTITSLRVISESERSWDEIISSTEHFGATASEGKCPLLRLALVLTCISLDYPIWPSIGMAQPGISLLVGSASSTKCITNIMRDAIMFGPLSYPMTQKQSSFNIAPVNRYKRDVILKKGNITTGFPSRHPRSVLFVPSVERLSKPVLSLIKDTITDAVSPVATESGGTMLHSTSCGVCCCISEPIKDLHFPGNISYYRDVDIVLLYSKDVDESTDLSAFSDGPSYKRNCYRRSQNVNVRISMIRSCLSSIGYCFHSMQNMSKEAAVLIESYMEWMREHEMFQSIFATSIGRIGKLASAIRLWRGDNFMPQSKLLIGMFDVAVALMLFDLSLSSSFGESVLNLSHGYLSPEDDVISTFGSFDNFLKYLTSTIGYEERISRLQFDEG